MHKKNSKLMLHLVWVGIVLLSLSIRFPIQMVKADDSVVFTNVTDAAGLYYRNETWGWAWGDYDDDGYMDIFLGHHPALNEEGTHLHDSALMHNNHNGTFTDVIHTSGISLQEDRHDHAWIDYDEDGDLDLWVTIGARGGVGDGPKQLFRNNGNGQFEDVAPQAGVDYPKLRGRGSAWLDFDLDGDLDLFATGAERSDAPNSFFRNNGNGTFTNITSQLTLDAYLGAMSQVVVADYDADGDPDMFVSANSTRLYRNDVGRFTNVTNSAGVATGSGNGAAWGDYDGDGDLDLFVTRGAQDLNGDYKEVSGSESRFAGRTDGGDQDGLDFTVGSGGSVTFDVQQKRGGVVLHTTDVVFLGPDGRHPSTNPFTLGASSVSAAPAYTPGTSTGIYIWQSDPGSWHIRWTASSTANQNLFSGIITAGTSLTSVSEVLFESPASYSVPNKLYRNNGNGTFTDVASSAGVADSQDCRTVDWGDYDNDGDLDAFVQTAGYYGNNAPDLLYRNNGNGTFTNMASSAGVSGTLDAYGWGGVWADYDNNGFLDLLTNHESWPWPLDQGRYELFQSQGNSNNWLMVDVRGVQSNSRAHGAKLWVVSGGVTQFREIGDNSHYFVHYTGPVHFGLGLNGVVDELRIKWPSGLVQTLTGIPANQRVTIFEGGSTPTATPTHTPTGTITPSSTPTFTPTFTPTPTATNTPTITPTPTFTLTPTPTNTIPPSAEIIIDNGGSGFSTVGTWQVYTGTGLSQYGTNFVYTRSGTGTSQAIFRPTIPISGSYEVYLWWPNCWSCATNAPFTIYHTNGSTAFSIDLNNRSLAGRWNSLGIYIFDAGTQGYVLLTNLANARVVADAIRLVPR